jgi:hypothetical protein
MSLTLLAGLNLLSASSIGEGLVNEARAASVAEQFSKISQSSKKTVNHSQFSRLLKAYIKRDKNGLNRVDYKGFKNKQSDLKAYIKSLEAVKVTSLSRSEQFAYWANLYNALTIDVVLEAYPVKSIKDIDISPGIFSNGPWGKKLVTIEGTKISLDDIEHQILRKVHKDPRVHYAVNCASVGCPNLQTEAFEASKLEAQLEKAAKDYVNSNRGVVVKGNRLSISKIYVWFKKDFGGNDAGVLAHLKKYAAPELKTKITKIGSINSSFYDWTLNDQSK